MKEYPLISVIVPVYKVESYLDRCIRSIVEQTYRNLEIILVDDGSPDNSGAICDAWAARDSRIKVIHKENGGGGLARNVALDAASGSLLAFVDSDDYIAPEMYSHLASMLTEGIDIAECGYLETTHDDAVFTPSTAAPVLYTPQAAMSEHIQDTLFRQLIWNKLYRAETVGDIRFPVGKKIDDEFFTYRVLANARALALSRGVYYAYRQQQSSVMHQSFSLRRLDGLEAKLQRIAFLKNRMPELETQAKVELIESCIFCMQNCLRFLEGTELDQAREIIHAAMEASAVAVWTMDMSTKKKLLIWLAQKNLEGTGRILNWLVDIHVLT